MVVGVLVSTAVTITPKLSSIKRPFIALKTVICVGLGGGSSSLLGPVGTQRRGGNSGGSWGVSLCCVSSRAAAGWLDLGCSGPRCQRRWTKAEDGLTFMTWLQSHTEPLLSQLFKVVTGPAGLRVGGSRAAALTLPLGTAGSRRASGIRNLAAVPSVWKIKSAIQNFKYIFSFYSPLYIRGRCSPAHFTYRKSQEAWRG